MTRQRRGRRSRYLEHVGVLVVAVLHHHRVVPGQSVGDAVLAFTAHHLEDKQQLVGEGAAHGAAAAHLVTETRDTERRRTLART